MLFNVKSMISTIKGAMKAGAYPMKCYTIIRKFNVWGSEIANQAYPDLWGALNNFAHRFAILQF